MGVSHRPSQDRPWDVARPEQGPLAWVMRNDARPGREPAADEAHWVAHARAGWSRQHLEQPADGVQRQMQAALQEVLGEPIEWQHAVVHRWRYAMPQPSGALPTPRCWWDGARGLGVCGDYFGGTGVEGAWQSAQALSDAMRRDVARATTPAEPTVADVHLPRAA
jgi:predicted NAD/FAD-dependent oxidoreductase